MSSSREMRSLSYLPILILYFTGFSPIEGRGYNLLHFVKFLHLMKQNGWDKDLFDNNQKWKQDYVSELKLEALKSNNKLSNSKNFIPTKFGENSKL